MKRDREKLSLHERLDRPGFQHALIATYAFDAPFFENCALEQFRALQEAEEVTVVLDAAGYEEIVRSAAAGALPRKANLRYLLHPIRMGHRRFHPKVFLFAGRQRGLLLVGSANFTEPGLGRNAEMVSAFDYEEGGDEAVLPLFQEAGRFFAALAQRWPGQDFCDHLAALQRDVPWLDKPVPNAARDELPVLLSNLERPLWDQLLDRLPDRRADRISVLSPYFDADPRRMMKAVIDSARPDKISLHTQDRHTTLTPAWLDHPAFADGGLEIRLCEYADAGLDQKLHAKAYAFECGNEMLAAMGSANFTTPAMLLPAGAGNVEVLLCYPLTSRRRWPVRKWLDPESSGRLLSVGSKWISQQKIPEASADSEALPIHLREALVEAEELRLQVDAGDLSADLEVQFSQPAGAWTVPVHVEGEGLSAALTAEQRQRLGETSALARLGIAGAAWQPASNAVLVINLQDADAGGELRQRRHLRAAQESPERFVEILRALAGNAEGQERLRNFLAWCIIPMDLPPSFYARQRALAPFEEAPDGLSPLPGLSPQEMRSLHGVTMDFVEFHRKRLGRHVRSRDAEGIPNFLHILRTVMHLLEFRLGQLLAGLEARSEVRFDHWAEVRENADRYYAALESLLKLVVVDYLNALFESTLAALVAPEFTKSLPALTALCDRAMRCRGAIERLRLTRLVVVNLDGSRVRPPRYFNLKCVLEESRWVGFEAQLRQRLQELERRTAV